MVFALDKDDGGLVALASEDEATTHCKAVDVEDGFWLFFADDGSPLEARFLRPSEPGSATLFSLHRAMSGRWLQERLDEVATVRGCGLNTVAELVETLKINRGKRIAADRML